MANHLRFSVSDGLAKIILDRPERKNAFTLEMIDAWNAALQQCRTNDEVKVVLVGGTGTAFCSGGDIVEMTERVTQSPAQRKTELFERIQRIPLALENLDKPVIAVVNGVATGAGLDLALMCDLRYAAASARFAETYLNIGLVPGAGGAHYLPRLVGISKSLEMFFTRDFIDAREAEQIGLVNKVFPDEVLWQEVENIAAKIAEVPQVALRMTKRAVYQSERSDLRTNLDLISSHYAVVTSSKDHRDAVEKFAAKRSEKMREKSRE
jgi:enoyl-CoA hydratase/carnithine racemase